MSVTTCPQCHSSVEVRARFVTGLTATPQRRDGHHPIIQMQLGPVRFTVDARNQAAHRPFNHNLIIRETGLCIDDNDLRAYSGDLPAANN